MSNLKVCSGCYQKKDKTNFLNKDIIKATCNNCRKKNKNIKKKQRCKENITQTQENARLPSQLSNIIYESLLEISGTNEFLENENEQFIIKEVLYLEPLIEELPITLNEEERSKEIANKIVTLASEGDGYRYIYHSQQKTVFYYWCNMRKELDKHSPKHKNPAKQRDTDSRIQRHSCGGCISIKIDYQNNLIFFKLNHILHAHVDHVEVTSIIKEYIHANIN